MKEKIKVFDTDEGIIEWKSVEGWVGKDGRFYGNDKRQAIYGNCTHKRCEKGHEYGKNWINCPTCAELELPEKYLRLEYKEWDGKTPLAIYDTDKFFFDIDDIYSYIEDEKGIDIKDLKLIICEPAYLSEVDESLWEEVLPEDWEISDVSKEVAEKLKELNQVIRNSPPASWWPSKFRTRISEIPAEKK